MERQLLGISPRLDVEAVETDIVVQPEVEGVFVAGPEAGHVRIAGIGKAMGKSIREFKEELNTDSTAEKKEEGVESDGKA